jgi:hypothetical protein
MKNNSQNNHYKNISNNISQNISKLGKIEDKIENDNESSIDSLVEEEKKGINDVLNNITKSQLNVEKSLKSNGIQYNIKPESFKEEPNTMSSDHNITSNNNKDKIEAYNSENSNLNLVSIKKRNRSNNLDNNEDVSTTLRESNNINIKINAPNFKEQNNLLKNNLNDSNNKVKVQHDNILKILNNINNAGLKTSRDEKINKDLENNSSFPKASQNQLHVSMYPKKDTIKSPLTPNSNRIDKNLINNLIELNTNKSPLISKIMSNNNFYKSKNISNISIKNQNKTFTYFPKIKNDSLEQKIIQKNNFNEKKNVNIIAQTLNEVKYPKHTTKINSYDKRPKKVLLINPDNIPSNILLIRKKNKSNNKNRSLQNEKGNKTTKIKSLKDQISLPLKLNTIDDDILK